MSEFCRACSFEMFGKDFREFAGLVTEENPYPLVLCEGCGPIQVNNEGDCISKDCLLAGEYGHGGNWNWEGSEPKSRPPESEN